VLNDVQREMVAAAAQAGRAAAASLIPATLPGVVISVDPTNTTAMVQADGPNDPHGAAIICPITLAPGDRVMLQYSGDKPACFVVGRRSGDMDDWHLVGQSGEPPFLNAWGNSASTFPPGQNGRGQVMFTKRSGRVELRGQCERSTGAADIFTLPEEYWPDNDLTLSAQGALGGHISITIEFSTGVVATTAGNLVLFDGVSYLARVQQTN
jgi:hypothetical protein